MSNKNKRQELVPQLRFPEFRDKEEWKEKALGDVCFHFKGFAFKSKYYTASGRRVVRVSDMGFDYIKNETGAIYINEKKAKLYEKWKLMKDDLIITTVGSKPPVYDSLVGRTIVVKLKDEDSLLNQNAVCLRANKNIEQKFLNVLFKRKEYISFIESIIRGNANQGSIALVDLFKYTILKPKSKEQQKIANCLTSLDQLITTQTQKLDSLKAHKKGLMQQLFPAEGETVPKLRFAEFRDAGEWEEALLGEIAKFSSGGTPAKNVTEYWGGNIPWISASSMHDTKIEKSDSNITEMAVQEGARVAKKGVLLILVRGSMLHKRIPVGIPTVDVAFNQDVKALTLKSIITEQFLLYFLLATETKLLSAVTKTGIGAGKLDTSDLNQFVIKIPSREEQQKITDCFTSLDKFTTTQAKKINTLKMHKKGLMQQLFPSTNEEDE